MAKPKSGVISFDEVEQEPIKEILPDNDTLMLQVASLSGLLAELLNTVAPVTGNGSKAKNRCYPCELTYTHENWPTIGQCPCVCHRARTYLTELARG